MIDKKANVSGVFYKKDNKDLSLEVDSLLSSIETTSDASMILVPHAGYIYSGAVAAAAFKAAANSQIKTVIVIGVSHFHSFNGIAIWPKGSFSTPLGSIPIDESLSALLLEASSLLEPLEKPFEKEHSLEVELPFLQKTFPHFSLVALLTGHMSLEECESFSLTLYEKLAGRKDVLLVISSDFSHFHNETKANLMDQTALALIKECDAQELWKQNALKTVELCGIMGTTIALFYAKKKGIDSVSILKRGNSSSVTDDKDNVVGYASIAFHQKLLNERQKKILLQIARQTLEGTFTPKKENDLRLLTQEGAFVSLYVGKDLRGCMGEVFTESPLYQTIHEVTLSSSKDSRFPPLTQEEKERVRIQISLLSKPQKISSIQEIRLGTHGIIILQGTKKGLYLPQVATETGWPIEELLSQLCIRKANLPPLAWQDSSTTIYIFSTQIFTE